MVPFQTPPWGPSAMDCAFHPHVALEFVPLILSKPLSSLPTPIGHRTIASLPHLHTIVDTRTDVSHPRCITLAIHSILPSGFPSSPPSSSSLFRLVRLASSLFLAHLPSIAQGEPTPLRLATLSTLPPNPKRKNSLLVGLPSLSLGVGEERRNSRVGV